LAGLLAVAAAGRAPLPGLHPQLAARHRGRHPGPVLIPRPDPPKMAAMSQNDPIAQLKALAERFDRLAEQYRRLAEENRSLRQAQEQLVAERAQLLNKNEQARSRVEAMIARLKSLEHNA